MDDRYELVAGCFASDTERSRRSGEELGLPAERVHASYGEMAAAERGRGDPIDVVAIVTPNHLHLPVSATFLEAGFHVICDKPLTASVAAALELARRVGEPGRPCRLSHN